VSIIFKQYLTAKIFECLVYQVSKETVNVSALTSNAHFLKLLYPEVNHDLTFICVPDIYIPTNLHLMYHIVKFLSLLEQLYILCTSHESPLAISVK
jgi:hypothetical protein